MIPISARIKLYKGRDFYVFCSQLYQMPKNYLVYNEHEINHYTSISTIWVYFTKASNFFFFGVKSWSKISWNNANMDFHIWKWFPYIHCAHPHHFINLSVMQPTFYLVSIMELNIYNIGLYFINQFNRLKILIYNNSC